MDIGPAGIFTEEFLRIYFNRVANQSNGQTGNITFGPIDFSGKPFRCPLQAASLDNESWDEGKSTLMFYTIFTSVTFLVGLLGNGLCLLVFGTNARASANSTNTWSYCLAALSLSDLLVLVVHVSVEWSRRGLLPLLRNGVQEHVVDRPGVCQAYLMLSYLLRMNSVWLIVLFTVERYIGVCRPLQRKILCTRSKIRRAVLVILLMATIVSSYKPLLSEVENGKCGSPQDHSTRAQLAFALDTCYAFLITLFPFIVILTLNILISRRLFARRHDFYNRQTNSAATGNSSTTTSHDAIGLQFGVTMIAISTCFVILNCPYFIVWCLKAIDIHRLISAQQQHQAGGGLSVQVSPSGCIEQFDLTIALLVTRAIFHLNYCVNFFLYSLTGSFFRRELVRLLRKPCPRSLLGDSGFHMIPISDRSNCNGVRSMSTSGICDRNYLSVQDINLLHDRRISSQF